MDFALPKLFPLSTIMPSSIAISPVKDGKPVPSIIFAFLINKSNIMLKIYPIYQEIKYYFKSSFIASSAACAHSSS